MNPLLETLGVDLLRVVKTFASTFAGTVALGWSGVVTAVGGGHLSSAKDLLLALVLSAAAAGFHAAVQVVDDYLKRTPASAKK